MITILTKLFQRGIKGYVTDLNNLPVENAQIRIKKHHPESSHSKWRSKNVKSNKDGKYWRILVPGNYTVQVSLLKPVKLLNTSLL